MGHIGGGKAKVPYWNSMQRCPRRAGSFGSAKEKQSGLQRPLFKKLHSAVSNVPGKGQGKLPQPLLLPLDGAGEPVLQLGQLLQLLPVQPVGILVNKESKRTAQLGCTVTGA